IDRNKMKRTVARIILGLSFFPALVPLCARAAVAAPAAQARGIDPALFRVERVDYALADGRLTATIQAFVSPKLAEPGASILLNPTPPVQVAKDQARFAVELHPGPLLLSFSRVGSGVKPLQWQVEIRARADWRVSPSCSPFRASWEASEAPMNSRFE